MALCQVLAATQVWVESSLVNVYPDSLPSRGAKLEARIYAARDEYESLQLCVRPDRKSLEDLMVRMEGLERIPPPIIYREDFLAVGAPSSRGWTASQHEPDVLIPVVTARAEAGLTTALWLTYFIPVDTKAGIHKGRIVLEAAKGPKWTVPLTIEVFDFTLPEVSTLRSLFPMDRKAIREQYSLRSSDLSEWKPIYDALSKHRISYSVWEDSSLVNVKSNLIDATAFQEHLEYAANAGRMSVIDAGRGRDGIEVVREPASSTVEAVRDPETDALTPIGRIERPMEQDPLQLYLHDLGNWLQSKGWLNRACVQVMPLPERGEWHAARRAFLRVWRADKRFKRIMVGTPHPYFERYTDIFAAPLAELDPTTQAKLREGVSLTGPTAQPAQSVVASSTAYTESGAGSPTDAYDGTALTFWQSASAPTDQNPEWLDITLEQPVQTREIAILWKPGQEARDSRVLTSVDGTVFSEATTSWKHVPAVGPYELSRSDGTFKVGKLVRRVNIEFRDTVGGQPVAVAEVLLGKPETGQTSEPIPPVELWLQVRPDSFPSLAADAHAVEARLVPWVCWGHHLGGFIYDALNRWPLNWLPQSSNAWEGGGTGNEFLFYPGPGAPVPSVRIERLRDGLEDYEYLAMLEQAIEANETDDLELRRLASHQMFPTEVPPAALEETAKRVLGIRLKIGRALTRLAKKGDAKDE
ncbi:MAG: DUF4091 domain-containing protein [Candidatus Hydrogenedentes bacterium]|nr:DUF4091 domain-containing protein [Candidatus Hydrogenedentota bacterium]